jgi:HD-GYP domain-containing protein (c-di-GMP phosphodiesterase class II)
MEQTVAELERCANTQFDPAVLSAFLRAVEAGRIGLPAGV